MLSRVSTRFKSWKATSPARQRECFGGLGAVEDPGMCGCSLYGNREILGLTDEAPSVRTGKARSRSR